MDISERRGADLFTDLATRDFTINAMAVRLLDLRTHGRRADFLDPYQGMEDLGRRLIRAVQSRVFVDDPLRIMRAVRLAAELGFVIEPATLAWMRTSVHHLPKVAAERVRDELFRMLACPRAAAAVSDLDTLGALEMIVPEITALKTPNPGLWTHSITTVIRVEEILGRLPSLFPAFAGPIEAHLAQMLEAGVSRTAALKLAALLHDVAKPQTFSVSAEGQVHFFGHDELGSRMNAEIARRLRLSAATQAYVERMTRHHLRPLFLAREAQLTDRAIYRYFRDTGPEAIDLLIHGLADAAAHDLDDPRLPTHEQIRLTFERMLGWQQGRTVQVTTQPFVNGDDLIRILGLTPGPQFRTILEDIREQQAIGRVTTRDEALAYLARHRASR